VAAPNITATLVRVREILEETCDQDGQQLIMQESARRKAYRAGINAALDEIRRLKVSPPRSGQ
jgi:hypothetical protein